MNLSIMQGRLSTEVAGKFQYFPIHNWRSEFVEAQKLGFNGIEWIVSDFSNPLFDPFLKDEILELTRKTGIQINSLSLDLFLHKTLDRYTKEEIDWVFKSINSISSELNLKRVCIPVEETSGIKNPIDGDNVKTVLKQILKKNQDQCYLLAIETDMSSSALQSFLNHKSLKNLGVIIDLGNVAAYGFKLQGYFEKIPEKIYSIHIKDRCAGIGKTTKLGCGVADFKYLKNNINSLNNLVDVTLQCVRSKDKYINDAKIAKSFLNSLFND